MVLPYGLLKKADPAQKCVHGIPISGFIHKEAEAVAGAGDGEQLLDSGGTGRVVLISHGTGDIAVILAMDKERRNWTVFQGLQGIAFIRVKAAQQPGRKPQEKASFGKHPS